MFEDETGFSKHPRLSRLWTPCGQRARIPTRSEHRQRLNVFGWVAPLLGRHGLMRLAKGNTPAFLALLRRLRQSLRGKTIHLYVDRAPWHRGRLVDQFLASHLDLYLNYLHSYQPGLNPPGTDLAPSPLRTHHQPLFRRPRPNLERRPGYPRRWSPQKIKRLCHIN